MTAQEFKFSTKFGTLLLSNDNSVVLKLSRYEYNKRGLGLTRHPVLGSFNDSKTWKEIFLVLVPASEAKVGENIYSESGEYEGYRVA